MIKHSFKLPLIIIGFGCMANHQIVSTFAFIDNKTNNVLSDAFLRELVDTFSPDIFFETGTFEGKDAVRAAQYFGSVHTVELSKKFFNIARQETKWCDNVHVYHGSSPDIIKTVAPTLNGRIIFWLDAHYSGGDTALSNDNMSDPEAVTAIRKELETIKNCGISDCVILIDDMRGFGSTINDTEYLGCWAYPSVQKVRTMAQAINPNFTFALLGDILLIYDSTRFSPNISTVAQACTQSRFYDGKNLNDHELLVHEKTIMQAKGQEKSYIKQLYTMMTDWKDPMFHHDLWYALVCIEEKNWQQARVAIEKVPTRTEYFNKRRQDVKIIREYNHWRIDYYKNIILQNLS